MRVQFDSAAIPTRAAKRLKQQNAIKESLARQWTAYVLGYRDWYELEQQLGKAPPSILDEQLPKRERAARRTYQLDRLRVCLAGAPEITVQAETLLDRWRPSAARPQEAAARPADASTGLFLAYLRRIGDGQPLDPVEAEPTLLAGLDNPLLAKLAAGVAHYAVELLPSPNALHAAVGRRLLEALATRGDIQAVGNLAVSLMLGHGGPKDEKRAMDLFQRVVNAPDADPRSRSLAQQALGNAHATGLGGRRANRQQALALYEQGAANGDSTAAFNAGLHYGGEGPHAGSVPSDYSKAARYYRQAAEGGLVSAMCNLGLLLGKHPELARHGNESGEWLERAATKGDRIAQRVIRYSGRGGVAKLAGDLASDRLTPQERAEGEAMFDAMQEDLLQFADKMEAGDLPPDTLRELEAFERNFDPDLMDPEIMRGLQEMLIAMALRSGKPPRKR